MASQLKHSNRRGGLALLGLIVFGPAFARCQPTFTWQQKEEFLLKAKVVATRDAKKGVTGTRRVTLSDGTITHDASVQTVNEEMQKFTPESGLPEFHLKDSYKFNIAAWKLAILLGIDDMVPPSVERRIDAPAAVTWWVEDVMMDEQERQKQKLEAPNQTAWASELATMHLFDQLISNIDRNQGNILIDKNWRLWLIDHTRAFRPLQSLRNPALVTRADRAMLAKMKLLDADSMKRELGRYLSKVEIDGVLARRNLIVKLIEAKGEAGLMDRAAR